MIRMQLFMRKSLDCFTCCICHCLACFKQKMEVYSMPLLDLLQQPLCVTCFIVIPIYVKHRFYNIWEILATFRENKDSFISRAQR